MEQRNYLIDTNALIDYIGNRLSKESMLFMHAIVDEQPIISVICKIELLGFNTSKEHYAVLEGFVDESLVLYLTKPIVEKCIELRKKYKIKLPDAIIASTALVNGFILITANTIDFENIDELEIVNPHNL